MKKDAKENKVKNKIGSIMNWIKAIIIFLGVIYVADYVKHKIPTSISSSIQLPSSCCLPEGPNKLEGVPCKSQDDCGGTNSGVFCPYSGRHECTRAYPSKFAEFLHSGVYYRYEQGSVALSYQEAQNWCESIGKKLYDAHNIQEVCKFIKNRDKKDSDYWVSGGRVLHFQYSNKECFIKEKSSEELSSFNALPVCQ